MGRNFSLAFISVLVCAVCLPLLSETRYVSKTGSNEPPYTTPETAARSIQAALDRSFLGDTVLVGPGDYEESITLDEEGMTLIGAGRDCCRIIVPGGEDVVGIVGESRVVELRGFAVIGGDTGIFMFGGSNYVLIADCLVEGAAECGLLIQGWVDISVLDTVFRGVPKGIRVMRDEDPWAEVGLRVSGCEFVDTVDGIHVNSECTTEVTESSFLRYRYGVYDTWGAATLADSCTFLEGRCGISAMTVDGVLRASNCVFAFNTWEAVETDQRGLVTDSLFYANSYAYGEWDGGDELDFIRCTFVSNRTALGLVPGVTRGCIFWENGEDVPYLYDSLWPQTWVLEHCFINDPRFAGRDGNVSGDPEFVGWAAFNETDNPMHVDGSAHPRGDGSAERPFSSLEEALLSFDFRVREGSVCLGAGALGGDIGYPAGIAASGVAGSERVAIEMAPGSYEARHSMIPPRMTVYGVNGDLGRPSMRAEEVLLEKGARVSGLEFRDTVVEAHEAQLSDCELHRSDLCLYGGSVAGCKVLGGRTYLAYGSPWGKIRNCLFAKSGDGTAVNLSYSGGLHQFVNCTIVSPDVGLSLGDHYRAGRVKLTNCIIGGRVTGSSELLQADYCLFSEGWPGEGNIEGEPVFVDAENEDFRLRPGSPCIDAGSLRAALKPEVSVTGQEATLSWSAGEDLSANPRISGGGVDMGAYEYQAPAANFVVEHSSDLELWQEGGTTSGFEWVDDSVQGIKRRFYRVGLRP
jgi:hypothetical protein